jgi:hypothetical protein
MTKTPTFRTEPDTGGPVSPDGCVPQEATLLLSFLETVGKTPKGSTAVLFMALATILEDTRPPEEHQAVAAACPQILLECVRQVRSDRAGGEQ